ncbi:hypothetical protein EBR03_07965 [bacterium]|nr:hypothetical protein [bacterium]
MTPYKHAQSSALKWGGDPMDYVELHDWFDETKAFTGDWTHRALRHHSAGIQWAIKEFGHVITNMMTFIWNRRLKIGHGKFIDIRVQVKEPITETTSFMI